MAGNEKLRIGGVQERDALERIFARAHGSSRFPVLPETSQAEESQSQAELTR